MEYVPSYKLNYVCDGVIFDDETLIGYSWDILKYIKMELVRMIDHEDFDNLEEFYEISIDLMKQLQEHDGLVIVNYHPMGAYFVHDLVEKNG